MPRSPDEAERAPDGPAILVVSDQRDWHARQMEAAFAAAGARALRIDLAACGFDTKSASGLDVARAWSAIARRGACAHDLGGLVRGGHQAPRRPACARANVGVVVWNDARAIERCVDKSMTSFLIARAGLPTPADLDDGIARRRARARRTRGSPAGRWCSSPCSARRARACGSFAGPDDLPPPEDVAGVYYLQRFQPNAANDFRDYRLFVLRGRVIAAMMRRASTWITNVKQGGEPVGRRARSEDGASRHSGGAKRSAPRSPASTSWPARDGAPTVLEVNSMPAWRGLQRVSKRNIAEAIASALMDELSRSASRRRAR